jgi:hypothetical protein
MQGKSGDQKKERAWQPHHVQGKEQPDPDANRVDFWMGVDAL